MNFLFRLGMGAAASPAASAIITDAGAAVEEEQAKALDACQRCLDKAEKALARKREVLAKANAKLAACRATVDDKARRTPPTTLFDPPEPTSSPEPTAATASFSL